MVRTPRVVEKRIPVTYTYNVPHVTCYRVPLDACGNPITTVVPSTTAPATTVAPTEKSMNPVPDGSNGTPPPAGEPKPAKKSANGEATETPELGKDAPFAQPLKEEAPATEAPKSTPGVTRPPMGPVPSTQPKDYQNTNPTSNQTLRFPSSHT
jgi:hypothetical protein